LIDLVDGGAGTILLSHPGPLSNALVLGGPTAGNASVLRFEVGNTADLIFIASAQLLIQAGGASVEIVPIANCAPGTYDLIQFPAGSATGLENLTLATPSVGGFTFSLQSTPTAEQLVVTPEPGMVSVVGLVAATMVGRRSRRA
jgi:hypothetical protein